MFQELKKCKTFKELFTTLGVEPFEKMAVALLTAWCVLPLFSAIHRVYWALVAVNDMQQRHAVENGYKIAVQLVGSLSLYVAIFFLIGRVSVTGKEAFIKLKKQPWHILLGVMLVWSCISTILSDNVSRSFSGSVYRFEGLQTYFYYAGAYVCACCVTKEKMKKRIMTLFVLVANIVSVLIILQDFGNPFLNKCFLDQAAGMFFHYNHAGYYLNVAIVLAIGLYLYEPQRKYRLLYGFSITLLTYGILVNSTFGAFIGTCLALIMVLVFFVRKNGMAWRMLTPVLIITSLIIASYLGYVPTSSGEDMKVNLEQLFQNGKTIAKNDDGMDSVGHGRMVLWKQGLKMVPKRPIFGYGPEQLDEELSEIMWIDRPDNELIQYAIFLGIPGLLFYLSALVTLLLRQWKNMKILESTTLIAAGGVIAYLISSLMGTSMFYTTCYFFLFLALSASEKETKE